MNKILTTVFLVICTSVFGQDKVTTELKDLSDNNKYAEIIKNYTSNTKDYSAKSMYYIGLAYYMTEDDNNCIKYMDLSIKKDSKDPAPYYIKASTLNYMGKYKDAIECFNDAINLKSDDAVFYSGLGDSYYQLEKYQLAIESYEKATKQTNCQDRPYSMIAQCYSDLNDSDKALEAFYIAKSKISKETNSYLNALYNIGLYESLKGNYDKAEPAFLELTKIDSTDYHSYAKLIQIYYHQKEYDKAKPYKDILYNAYNNGLLTDNLKDMFCFDQFKWNDYLVQVFERYESENKGDIYNKHIFYVVDNKGNIVLRVQTEFSPISVELGGAKYLLCANKGATHYNPGIGFNDDFKYEDLKAEAIKLIEKYMK